MKRLVNEIVVAGYIKATWEKTWGKRHELHGHKKKMGRILLSLFFLVSGEDVRT